MTNLLNYGATILSAPEPTTSSKSAQNLVTNLRTRSSRNIFKPIIDSLGNRATFETCLVSTDSQVGPEGDQFELAFDLGKSMMVNAILVAQDQFNDYADTHTDFNEYFQNFNLFIGESPNWT